MIIMNIYQNGKIYKVLDQSDNILYIGSTYKTLKNRQKNHRGQYNFGNTKKLK